MLLSRLHGAGKLCGSSLGQLSDLEQVQGMLSLQGSG